MAERISIRVRQLVDHWWLLGPYLVALSLLVTVIRVYLKGRFPPPLTNDGGFFLYSGVSMAHGKLPYLTLWDVKPPAIHETVALVALVTGGNRWLVYFGTTVLTATSVIVSCILLPIIVHEIVDSKLGAFVAGVAPLAYSTSYLLVPTGIRPKYFVVMFGLSTLYFAVDQRPFLAGLVGGLAASYWQPGIVFVAVAIGVFSITDEGCVTWTRQTLNATAGVACAAVVVVMPFILGGSIPQLVDQVIVTPLLVSEGSGLFANLRSLANALRAAWIVPVLGLLGMGIVLAEARDSATGKRRAVLTLPIGWFVLIALVDFDGFADAIPLVFVSGLGAGLYVGQVLPPEPAEWLPRDRQIALMLAVLIVSSGVLMLPWVEQTNPAIGEDSGDRFGHEYWKQTEFHVCHVRLSSVEKNWIQKYDADRNARRCSVPWLSGG